MSSFWRSTNKSSKNGVQLARPCNGSRLADWSQVVTGQYRREGPPLRHERTLPTPQPAEKSMDVLELRRRIW